MSIPRLRRGPWAGRAPLGPASVSFAFLFAGALSCVPTDNNPPVTGPVFPTGVAVAGDHVLVVSSDFDKSFDSGALLAASLSAADDLSESSPVVRGAYDDAVFLPRFGDRPVVTSGGERVYVPTKETNRVNVVDVGADGTLSCGDLGQTCGEAPFTLQLVDNDPFAVVITGETRDDDGALVRVDGLTTFLASPLVVFFSDDRRREGAAMMQIDGSLDLGVAVAGVRSAVLRPEVAGSDPVIIAAVDLARAEVGFNGARLVLFEPSPNADFATFDVTATTGALSMRDIALVTGEDGENDALIAVLRDPDGIARFEIDEDAGLPSLRLTGVAPICREPGALARTTSGGVERLIVTCRVDDAILAFDPLTLEVTDAVRFAGREPYGIAVVPGDDPAAPAAGTRAFVTFFLDNSVGVLDLVAAPAPGAAAIPRLRFRGRIGDALPAPEDGRE